MAGLDPAIHVFAIAYQGLIIHSIPLVPAKAGTQLVGGELGEDEVLPSHIKGRALSLAVPKGSMTETQRAVLEDVRQWAMTLKNPVDIVINEF